MADGVICDHCGVGNQAGSYLCTQCGAPLKSDFGRMAGDRVREIFLPLVTQAVDWPVVGADISRYNGVMDFGRLATRAQFVMMQSSFGATGLDSGYGRNLKGALANGLVPFIYHYLKPSRDWRKSAQLFADVWLDSPKIGYPWGDLEDAEGLDKQGLMGWTEKFWREFEERIGAPNRLGCYTSPGFLNRSLNMTNWLKLRPLWVAHWTSAPTPTLPNEWGAIHNPRPWTLWQWKVYKPGSDYGSGSGAIDLNRYNGGVVTFNTEFGTDIKALGEVEPPPPAPGDEIVPLYQVTARGSPYTNLRGGPRFSARDIGNALPGDVLPVVAEDGDWLEVRGWVNKNYVRKV